MARLEFKQTLWLIALTLVYLCFELGFNARLLDVVGGSATAHDVERIEIYGRTLSGIAAALVVLQLMLRRRVRGPGPGPSWGKIGLCCLLTTAAVFGSIKTVVDVLVATRDAEFRRMAVNSIFLQRALVDGRLTLDGLVDDNAVFVRPEGKAFLALFPFLAVSVSHLDERTKGVKDQLIGASVRQKSGGPQGYYDSYTKAMKEIRDKWQKYSRIPSASDDGLLREQDKAWGEYLRSLSRQGWTPQTVPPQRRGAVVAKVRKSAPVPPDWDPADELTFRDAVEQRYRRAMSASARAVTVGQDRIPPGLAYPAFVARAGIQQELRKALRLPPGASVATAYAGPQEFTRLYEQFVAHEVRQLRAEFDAAAPLFEPGARYYDSGKEAARAAIVPPVALFFSLLGAIGHLSKLLYLLATLLLLRRAGGEHLSRRAAWSATGVLVLVFGGIWGGLSLVDNNITRSELFQQMIGWARQSGAADGAPGGAGRAALANIAHVVAVGQGYTYPINETIRTEVLHGMSYGYHPQEK